MGKRVNSRSCALALALLLPLGAAAQNLETYTFNNLNVAIPDGSPAGAIDSRVITSGIAKLSGVRVKVELAGKYNGDLYAYLVQLTPEGTNFCVLLNRVGRTASRPYGYDDAGMSVTFDDLAAVDIHQYRAVSTPAPGTPLVGTWKPDGRNVDPMVVQDTTGRTATLSSFLGKSGSGEWTLFVADVDTGAQHYLVGWELELNGSTIPTVTWAAPADIVYGTPLSASQLNATSPVQGTFSYDPPLGTLLNAGPNQILSVLFTPSNTTVYSPTTREVVINVTKKQLTVTGANAGKTYGAPVPVLTGTYSGFVSGDSTAKLTSLATFSSSATASSPAGTYAIVPAGVVSSNYFPAYVNGTLTVDKAPLTITAANANRLYGAPNPAFTASYSGFVNNDTVNSLTSPVVLSTSAGTGSSVGNYAIVPGSAASANYNINYVNGTLSIGKAPLTITANSTNKFYGAALPAFSATYSGLVAGDTPASLTTPPVFSCLATPASAVGSYVISVSAATSGNYNISFVNGTLSVERATLTITANNAKKTYGAAIPALTLAYSGFVNNDTPSNLSAQGTASTTATTSSPVGTYPISVSGAASGNYSFVYVSGTLTVERATLTITANNTNKVYGAAIPALTASYSGFVNNDTPSNLSSPAVLSTTASAASPAGVYPINVTGASSGNYAISFVNGSLSVDKAALTIRANNATKLYGAALPAFSAIYTGFVGGDTVSSLALPPSFSTAATAASPVGAYPITPYGAASANYSISYVDGSLTVDRAPLVITAVSTNKLYGATVPALAASYAGLVNNDTPASLTGQPVLSTTATASSPVGSYPITVTGASSSSYSISYVNGTLTVGRAPLTITANSLNKTYGAAVPTLTVSYSGFVNNDTAANLTSPPVLSTTATATSPVGTYPISISGAAAANYTINMVSGLLTVDRAVLTITANNASKVYGAALPAFSASYSGFVSGEGASSLTTPPTIGTTATASSPAGTYPITASGAVSPNYSMNYVPGVLTINKAFSTGALASSANPALPRTQVIFSFSASAVAPGAGTPDGSVTFRVDGALAGIVPLVSGVAQFSTTTLPVGVHTITAEYPGSANFLASSAALSPSQLINTQPVAGNDTIERYSTNGVKVDISALMSNDSDADGDFLTFLGVSPVSAQGASVTYQGGWVYYMPWSGFGGADTFTYTVSDGRGTPVTGTVTVALKPGDGPALNLELVNLGDGSFLLRFYGIPNRACIIQYSSATNPLQWAELTRGVGNANGIFEYIDRPPGGVNSRFYRAQY